MRSPPSRAPFSAICFDCDSTLSTIEGVDELAVRAGCAAQIVPLTSAAMEGTLALEEVYKQRLDFIKPDREALDWLASRYIATLVPGAAQTIARLLALGKAVHIVSGGLRQPVAALGAHLGISDAFIHAVAVTFDAEGRYGGFDTSSPLAQRGGKAEVCRALARRYGSIALVGDGITDLEARDGGAYVAGFGGVVARPAVVSDADVFVADPSLAATLEFLLSAEERRLAGI